MSETGRKTSFWSRPAIRWTATVLLGIVFILAFVILLAADLVSRDLLDPDLYNNALHEEDIYNRIYTDLLADPEMVKVTALMLGDLNVDPSLSTNLVSMASSTLYLVLPPDTIQNATEGTINNFTAYLRGDVEELDPQIPLTGLDSDLMADRIVDGIAALTGELLAGNVSNQPAELGQVDMDELAQYAAEFSQGNIGPLPAGVSSVRLENLSAEQQDALRQALLGESAESSSPAVLKQVSAALLGGDLHSALTHAALPLLQAQAIRTAEQLADTIANSDAMNSVITTANALGQTTEEIIDQLNTVRSVMIFLDGVAIPLAFLVMVLALAIIVWIHANDLLEMLRTTGIVLVLTSALVALAWLVLGFLLRDALDARFAASSALPASLENMIADVVSNLAGTVWRDVWQTATIPLVLGVAFLILSFFPSLSERVNRWLEPAGRYRNLVLVAIVLAIVLVPLGLRALLAEIRQPDLVCNGHAELCDRPVNEIALATTHNAMSIADYGWLWPSHDGSLTNQLNAGVRGFLIDSHYWDDKAWIEEHLEYVPEEQQAAVQNTLDKLKLGKEDGTFLCHMMCSLGATDLTETLTEMRDFLENSPNEVVAIIFEDLVSPTDTHDAFAKSGLDALVYTYEQGTEWPTLREMIRQNRRVLVMAEKASPPLDWYLHAWDYTEETPYAFSELADFDDTSCEPNRGDTGKPFLLLNHWITRASPSRVDAAVLNDYDYLLERAQRCAEERGQIPNFVGVNFYLNGDVFEVVDELNGVRGTTEQ